MKTHLYNRGNQTLKWHEHVASLVLFETIFFDLLNLLLWLQSLEGKRDPKEVRALLFEALRAQIVDVLSFQETHVQSEFKKSSFEKA